jgi:spore coat protein U-like protein
MKLGSTISALVVCLLLVAAAHADNCSVTATAVAFGNYNQFAIQPLNMTGTITVTCNKDFTGLPISLTAGSGIFAQRHMTSSGGTLNYKLYTTGGYTSIWGDGTSGTVTVPVNVVNGSGTVSVYGQIPTGQMSPLGNYTDTITVTVTYGGKTAQTTFAATATITTACAISAVGTMNFGNLGLSFWTTDKAAVSANITYTCSSGLPATITLGQGLNPEAGSSDAAPLRRMRLGATSNHIGYNLYKDSGDTTVWGNTAATGVATTGTGSAQTATAYGKATHANVPVGSYSDTLVVTITF